MGENINALCTLEAYQHFLLGYFNIDSDAAPYLLCHRKLEKAHKLFFSKDVTVVGAGHALPTRRLHSLHVENMSVVVRKYIF
ncbi:hypothetical protein Tco_0898571 [Tanacetum coccineum]